MARGCGLGGMRCWREGLWSRQRSRAGGHAGAGSSGGYGMRRKVVVCFREYARVLLLIHSRCGVVVTLMNMRVFCHAPRMQR